MKSRMELGMQVSSPARFAMVEPTWIPVPPPPPLTKRQKIIRLLSKIGIISLIVMGIFTLVIVFIAALTASVKMFGVPFTILMLVAGMAFGMVSGNR